MASAHVRHVTVDSRDKLEKAIEVYKDVGITTLTLKGRSVTDEDLALLQDLPGLDDLDLSGCTDLTDAGLAHLQELTSLQHLILSFCINLTNAGINFLRNKIGESLVIEM